MINNIMKMGISQVQWAAGRFFIFVFNQKGWTQKAFGKSFYLKFP